MRTRWFVLLVMVVGALGTAACSSSGTAAEGVRPERGACVSEHPLATSVGLEILAAGGSATDAAIAMALALAVVYPQAGNLGGGGFALVVPAEGAPQCLDFRESAPAAADPALFLNEQGQRVPARSLLGPRAVAIPGTAQGLWDLHRQCGGRLRFDALVEPAIRLARQGFEIDAWLAAELAEPANFEKFNAPARELFYPGGQALVEHARLRQPQLADTLSLYAALGPRAFYEGRVARAIVAELERSAVPESRENGVGWMRLEDLSAYRTRLVSPVVGYFRGYEILCMPPPSSGGVAVLEALGILEGLPLDHELRAAEERARAMHESLGVQPSEHPRLGERMLHWWIEALRAAFADRAQHLGDPDFHTVPLDRLLSPEWIAERRIAISERAQADLEAMPLPSEGGETTHLSVVDSSGNAVALTTTLNTRFGSGIWVREAGFFLNNEIDDFAVLAGSPNVYGLVGSAANALRAGARPLSSMTPTVVRNAAGELRMVLGSPGGPRIISTVYQVLLRCLLLEQNLEEAVRAPRFHQQWRPAETEFEPGFEPELIQALLQRGHRSRTLAGYIASLQAIELDPSLPLPIVVSDPRRGGSGGVVGQAPSVPTRPESAGIAP